MTTHLIGSSAGSNHHAQHISTNGGDLLGDYLETSSVVTRSSDQSAFDLLSMPAPAPITHPNTNTNNGIANTEPPPAKSKGVDLDSLYGNTGGGRGGVPMHMPMQQPVGGWGQSMVMGVGGSMTQMMGGMMGLGQGQGQGLGQGSGLGPGPGGYMTSGPSPSTMVPGYAPPVAPGMSLSSSLFEHTHYPLSCTSHTCPPTLSSLTLSRTLFHTFFTGIMLFAVVPGMLSYPQQMQQQPQQQQPQQQQQLPQVINPPSRNDQLLSTFSICISNPLTFYSLSMMMMTMVMSFYGSCGDPSFTGSWTIARIYESNTTRKCILSITTAGCWRRTRFAWWFSQS